MTKADASINQASRQQAIDWLVEWRSGTMSDTQREALDRWCAANPAHAAAWAQVSGGFEHTLGQPLASLTTSRATADAALGALLLPHAGRRRRRLVGGTLAACGAVFASGLVAHRMAPLPGLLADAHTATAERRSLDLADGSRLMLDARTAMDLSLGPAQRLVRLRQGALIAEVAAEHSAPFVIRTSHGEVRSSGTRCMVRVSAERTEVAVLDRAVSLHGATRNDRQTLGTGQAARVDIRGAISPLQTPAEDLAAWQHGMLAVRAGTLGDVIEGLRPYRRGFIRLSPDVAQLPVLGVFPLDDTDHALQALADTLPVLIRRYQGGWLLVIEPVGAA